MLGYPREMKPPPLWREADFRRLWIGQVISEMGSRISREGIPLTAALLLGASPFQMSLITALGALAVFVFSLFAGVLADRVRRKPLLIGADVGRAVLIATIPAAAYGGVLTFAQLAAVVALTGVLSVLFQVAYQSYTPSLVDRARLFEANSKLALTHSIAEVTGPGLTGFLVQTLTAPVAMALDALSYLWSAGSLLLIRKPEAQPGASENPHVWREIAAGFAALRERPPLVWLAARASLMYFCFGTLASLYILFAIREVGMGPLALGFTIALGGLGNLIGALVAPRAAARFGLGPVLAGFGLLYGAAGFLIPAAPASLVAGTAYLAASQLFGDMFFVIGNVSELSYRQHAVPDALLGRVNSCMALVTQGVLPAGAIAGGLLAENYGMRPALWLAAGGICTASFLLLHPSVRRLRDFPS